MAALAHFPSLRRASPLISQNGEGEGAARSRRGWSAARPSLWRTPHQLAGDPAGGCSTREPKGEATLTHLRRAIGGGGAGGESLVRQCLSRGLWWSTSFQFFPAASGRVRHAAAAFRLDYRLPDRVRCRLNATPAAARRRWEAVPPLLLPDTGAVLLRRVVPPPSLETPQRWRQTVPIPSAHTPPLQREPPGAQFYCGACPTSLQPLVAYSAAVSVVKFTRVSSSE